MGGPRTAGRMGHVSAVGVLLVVVAVAAVPVTGPVGAAGTGTTHAGTDTAQSDLVTITIEVQTNQGDPVGGAQVEVSYDGGSNQTQTFSNGQALVDVPRGATVTIEVSDDEYVINRPVQTSDVDGETLVEVTMYPKATMVVESADEGGTVRDAQVSISKQGTGVELDSDTTGEDGVYQIEDIEAGTYDVSVVKRGYLRKQVAVNLTPPSTGRTVVLEEGTATLSVRVFDDHFRSPRPLADAVVTVETGGEEVLSGRTGDNGRRQLSVGVNGQYTIRVTKGDYTTAERTIVVGESGQDLEFNVRRTPTLTVRPGADSVAAGESVLVQVRNAYGESVEGATIQRDGQSVGTTDANGEVRIDIPSAGEFEIVATQDGVTSDAVTIEGIDRATETTTTETTTTETTEESDPLPGFGPVVALVAVLLAVVALRRRR